MKMDLGPKTPREHLIAEAALYQGQQLGAESTLKMLQQRGINYAQGFDDGVKSVTEPAIKRVLLALANLANTGEQNT